MLDVLIPDGLESAWLFLGVGTLSVLLVSASKAGFGGGLGMLSVPLMILACGGRAQLAAGILLAPLILNDYVALAAWRGHWDFRVVALLLPGAVVGIALGAATIWGFQQLGGGARADAHREAADAALMLAVGLIAIGFVGLQAWRSGRNRPLPFRPVAWQGSAMGVVAGFTSTLAHVGGPIVQMYMLPQRLPKDRHAASMLLYFWIGNQLKVVPYYALGLINPESLRAAAAFLPAVVVGTVAGVTLNRRVSQRQFLGVVYILLLVTGIVLVAKAGDALWR